MLKQKIKESELSFIEAWHTPRALAECLFSDFDNLTEFKKDKFGKLRNYQRPMLSDEPLIDFETTAKYHGLDEKQAFELRKNIGDIHNMGARKFGKTLITEKLDVPISMLHDKGFWVGFSSIDGIHLRGVLDIIKGAMESHPVLRSWKKIIRTAPNYKIIAKNGWHLDGINMNLRSKDPGHQFYGKHIKKLWIEERSFETEKVAEKREDALSELGAIFRFSGMTNFTKHSPSGKDFNSKKNKEKVLNLPQYVNPYWDEKERENREKKFGGKETTNYRVFVEGEIIEDGVSEFDMERVEACYKEKKKIKLFEIKKKTYANFRNLIVVTRPKNADRIFLCADIGDGIRGATEIIIISEVGDNYNYLYNITLHNLTHDEQLAIFRFLIEKLETNVIAIDCGEALGRTLADDFEKFYGKEKVVRYSGNSKIRVGFEKDDKGNIKIEKGKPVYREERMIEWAVRRLKVLLYETRMVIPIDYKFQTQFENVISTKSGTRVIYACLNENDHLFDAFKTFSIAQWLKKDFNQTKPVNKEWGTGSNSWSENKK